MCPKREYSPHTDNFETQTPLGFKHFVKTANPWCNATAMRMRTTPLALCIMDRFWWKTKMADRSDRRVMTETQRIPSLCHHQALKDCLERNKGDRTKCMKEWEEFQRSCGEHKRYRIELQPGQDPMESGRFATRKIRHQASKSIRHQTSKSFRHQTFPLTYHWSRFATTQVSFTQFDFTNIIEFLFVALQRLSLSHTVTTVKS